MSAIEYFGTSLPHEREISEIAQIAFEAYQADSPDYLALCITDTVEHARWLLQKFASSVKWDHPYTKLHRQGIEVKGGGRVMVVSFRSSVDTLMGIRPNKIVLFGNLGGFYYWVNSMEAEVRAIA